MERGEIRNPIMVLVLSLVTCGIYAIFWVIAACEDLNRGLSRNEFSVVEELLFTIVTCGVWGLWFAWRMSQATAELQKAWGVAPAMTPPMLFVTFLLGLGPVFVQVGLNNAWENGSPGGATGAW